MKIYMFRTVPLSNIRSLFTVHSEMVYVIQVCRQPFEQDQDGSAVPSWSCSKAVYKLVWHIALLSVQWINSWWWTEELSETRRVSCQNKFVKLVHLVCFIKKRPCHNIGSDGKRSIFSYLQRLDSVSPYHRCWFVTQNTSAYTLVRYWHTVAKYPNNKMTISWYRHNCRWKWT